MELRAVRAGWMSALVLLSATSALPCHYDSEGQPVDTIIAIRNEPTYRIMHPGGQGFS